jgi:hypothetical protein
MNNASTTKEAREGDYFMFKNENAFNQISLAPVGMTFPWHGIMRSKSQPLMTATSLAIALHRRTNTSNDVSSRLQRRFKVSAYTVSLVVILGTNVCAATHGF